ncbi:hypothetical protein Hbl1158_02845 [Halobaculum sp. CBA1158]|uniref:hypothetical protein n=1 Tax=Halobaculum sp. CBA1158 TaxID=2904243 RepID=UPI001F3C21EA|nr:hypothetical protein [Halobaculum sp. CBA1158]UIP00324.1 hypothetical protein Hbl1158_02845 [Halobaculum sp. CBA1158]
MSSAQEQLADGAGDTSDSTVELGDVAFDPVTIQDFRLSVEGNSSTGKSNTLAVILEDLADVPVPTLVVERLGALAPVRLVDEDIVVVGAREEEGVDLAVALEDLDQIGEWVLDRGMKVLLDISTYADYEDDKSRVHLAAATAIRSLNDRAHEKYRAGDRTKSLLVADECHWLAPKDSAPEPQMDEWVKRCRGQLIKASTEGGNKGISIIAGYQRRAFLHNGVIQLAQDFIAHRPGDEDIARTADALRCSEEDLAELTTGEILALGESITEGDLAGPTQVRKRSSPDPREETFDLPETPDALADVLDELQAEVQAEQERRSEREDELERLREENERLQERVDELQQELDDTERLSEALSNLQGGGGAAADVGEGVADLQERVDELKGERDALEADLADEREAREAAESEVTRLEDRVADLEAELQEVRAAFEGATEHVRGLAETFDVDVDVVEPVAAGEGDDGELSEAREERDRLRERVADLKERLADAGEPSVPTDYEDFLEDEIVQTAIEDAKSDGSVSEKYVRAVVAAILEEGEPVTMDRVLEFPGVTETGGHAKRAAKALENRRVVTVDDDGDSIQVDFHVDGVREIKAEQQRRERREQIMDDI